MTTFTPQQLIAAQQANVEAFSGALNKAFAGFEKLVALNLQVSKAALAQSQEIVIKAVSAGNPGALFALQAGLSQPVAENAVAYGRSVHEIMTEVGSDISAAATAQGENCSATHKRLSKALKRTRPLEANRL
ncbi:phasin family protein [Paraburkholderia kirstenboschensis]|uniref:phasin family protein n=1 Tax=Paraburkholderia kirstenboschensis TaxID=1245436 RepID=UPI000B03F8BD|nr:phasin family protein [Paraburkholderia kirstenboschensis]